MDDEVVVSKKNFSGMRLGGKSQKVMGLTDVTTTRGL